MEFTGRASAVLLSRAVPTRDGNAEGIGRLRMRRSGFMSLVFLGCAQTAPVVSDRGLVLGNAEADCAFESSLSVPGGMNQGPCFPGYDDNQKRIAAELA